VKREAKELSEAEEVKKPEVRMPILKSLSVQRVDSTTPAPSTTPLPASRSASTHTPPQHIADTAFDVNRKPSKHPSSDGQALGSSGGPKKLGFPWQNFGAVPSENGGGGGSASSKGRESTPKLWSVDRGKNSALIIGRSLIATQTIMLIGACTIWLYIIGVRGVV